MQHALDRQTIDVGRGLFVVRYVTAHDRRAPPIVHLTSEAPHGTAPRFILHPDAREAALPRPGASAIVLSEAAGRIVLSVSPRRIEGSVACKVTVETLSPGMDQGHAPPPASLQSGSLDILGHVAGRGDVRVGAGEWLGGPKMPARIEGLRIDWAGGGEPVELSYSVLTARTHPSQRRTSRLGAFAGSRGKAMPIVGLDLALAGRTAASARLSAELLFLGAPVLHLSGARISGAGPTGREPLVGLKLSLEQVGETPDRSSRDMVPAPADAMRQVRIFRAADRQTIAAAG